MVQGEGEAEAEEEVGERLAHREGRRRLVGRTGLEKLLRDEEGEEDLSLTWRKTKWITRLRSRLFWWRSGSHTQILYIVSRVPSEVVLSLRGEQQAHFKQRHTYSRHARECSTSTFIAAKLQTHEGGDGCCAIIDLSPSNDSAEQIKASQLHSQSISLSVIMIVFNKQS